MSSERPDGPVSPDQAAPVSGSSAQGSSVEGTEGVAAAGAGGSPRRRGPGKPRIEGYDLEEVLGRGAMGTVYRARQKSVDREVALKILHPELVSRPRIVLRMRREARMTARLAHPNLVAAVDMGQHEGRLWYAMEFVDGPTLSLRLRQEGRISEREALRLFIPLCSALEHLSEHGIVHRDVKPANILLDRRGSARLADLGLAFADEDPEITKHGGTLGTPQYISPEQAVDPARADARSDQWSFGATLFHAVCGRAPFAGESTAEVLSAVLYERVPDPRELEPSLSKGFALVLRKCLAREPADRYPTPAALLQDLERVRERRTPRVRRSSLDPVASQVDRRPLWRAAAGLALLVGGLAVGLFGPWGLGSRERQDEQVAVARSSPLLEDLEARVRAMEETPGTLWRVLQDLEPQLAASLRPRGEALRETLLEELARRRAEVLDVLELELEGALARGDHVAAWALVETEAERRLTARLGLDPVALSGPPVVRAARLERLTERVRTSELAALGRLREALRDTEAELSRAVDDLLERQDWTGALERLRFDADALLQATGFADATFQESRLEATLIELRTWMKIQRDRIADRWRTIDRELRARVVQRADRLREELATAGPSFSAASELVYFFGQELSRRRLTLEGIPEGLPFVARDALEREQATLLQLEDARLEATARARLETVRAEAAQHWARRDVDAARSAWSGLRSSLRPSGRPGAGWREELERECDARLFEAELVGDLLGRAADELLARSGSRIDLRLRGVKYANRVLVPGPDPLRLGFRVEGVEENVRLQELPARELARITGLDDPLRLSARERVALASLLQHDEEARASQALLRMPRVGDDGPLERVAMDLSMRATDMLEAAESTSVDEQRRAQRVAALLDPARLEDDPTQLRDELDDLLAEAPNSPAVRDARPRLEALRARLGAAPAPPRGSQALGPSSVEVLGGGRERLRFDFQRSDPGGWKGDDWYYDGLGWSHGGRVSTVAEFAQSEGLELALDPILPQSGALLATFRVELPKGAGPARLLVFEVDGIFVALVGERFPGLPGAPRLLVETAGLHALLERAQDPGEGIALESGLRNGSSRVLRVEVGPRRSRVSVSLDGQKVLPSRLVRGPEGARRAVVVRAWEPARLLDVEFELDAAR